MDVHEKDRLSENRTGTGFGLASMICGAAALVFFLLFINIPLAVAAIVLGIIQIVSHRKKLFAIVGIATAALSIILMLIGWGAIFIGFSGADSQMLEQFQQDLLQQYYQNETL